MLTRRSFSEVIRVVVLFHYSEDEIVSSCIYRFTRTKGPRGKNNRTEEGPLSSRNSPGSFEEEGRGRRLKGFCGPELRIRFNGSLSLYYSPVFCMSAVPFLRVLTVSCFSRLMLPVLSPEYNQIFPTSFGLTTPD